MFELRSGPGFTGLGMFAGLIGIVLGILFLAIAIPLAASIWVIAAGILIVAASLGGVAYGIFASRAEVPGPVDTTSAVSGPGRFHPRTESALGPGETTDVVGEATEAGAPEWTAATHHCPACGEHVAAGTSHCPHCGKALEWHGLA
jgi:hypothetical protein